MSITNTKFRTLTVSATLACVLGGAGVALVPGVASATPASNAVATKHGADDPAGHRKHRADDLAGHQKHGADDLAGQKKHGADDSVGHG